MTWFFQTHISRVTFLSYLISEKFPKNFILKLYDVIVINNIHSIMDGQQHASELIPL